MQLRLEEFIHRLDEGIDVGCLHVFLRASNPTRSVIRYIGDKNLEDVPQSSRTFSEFSGSNSIKSLRDSIGKHINSLAEQNLPLLKGVTQCAGEVARRLLD